MSTTTARKAPIEIAMMSCIPALGQLYNGQVRKGFIFLAVDITNLIVLSFLIFTGPTLKLINDFGLRNHVRPNLALSYSLSQLHFGSPFSLILTTFMLVFVALAMRDAYDNALNRHRQSLYPPYVIELMEATSSSYLLHFTLLFLCLILAFFFLVPPPTPRQFTIIEIFQNQHEHKEKVACKRISNANSKDSGKHEKREVRLDASHEQMTEVNSNISHRPAPRPNFPAEPRAQAVTRPRPLPLTQGVRSVALAPKSMTVPRADLNQEPIPPIPSKLASSKPQMPIPTPSEFGAQHQSVQPKPQPALNHHTVSSAMLGPTAVPIVTQNQASEETSARPSPIKRLGQTGNTSANLPVPTRAQYSRDSEKGSPLPFIRSAPRLDSGSDSNPSPNEHPVGPPKITTREDPNWPAYMADLQRRIKRAWFPPHGQENRQVVIVFKIHSNGELHDLRLSKSSGFALADQQAIAAIENAAPFRELPLGASDDVDIQFTFDYNVFNGGERGLIRRF